MMKLNIKKTKQNKERSKSFNAVNFEHLTSIISDINSAMSPILNEEMKKIKETEGKINKLLQIRFDSLKSKKRKLKSNVTNKKKLELKSEIVKQILHLVENFDMRYETLNQAKQILDSLDSMGVDKLQVQHSKLNSILKTLMVAK